jgi:hypothetical protein
MYTFRLLCNNDVTGAGAVAALLVGESLEVRVDFGEPGDLALASTDPVVLGTVPEGATVTISGGLVTGFTKPGLYKFKCTFVTGQFRWLEVFVFEARVLDLVPQTSSGSSSDRSPAERRRVIRALAQHPQRADGTWAALTGGGLNIAMFGG